MTTDDENTKWVDALTATEDIWEKTTFGSLVRSIRLSDDMTQKDLAEKLDVSPQFLSDVERDRKSIGIDFAKHLSKVLGYSLEPFLELLLRDQLKKAGLYYAVHLEKKKKIRSKSHSLALS